MPEFVGNLVPNGAQCSHSGVGRAVSTAQKNKKKGVVYCGVDCIVSDASQSANQTGHRQVATGLHSLPMLRKCEALKRPCLTVEDTNFGVQQLAELYLLKELHAGCCSYPSLNVSSLEGLLPFAKPSLNDEYGDNAGGCCTRDAAALKRLALSNCTKPVSVSGVQRFPNLKMLGLSRSSATDRPTRELHACCYRKKLDLSCCENLTCACSPSSVAALE
ncbi:hypothetical protein Smp_112610 [Schistosoma mansoni]|uniref:hypothetical protein n=1 Tax=Schistosoma mansoni TaxID=6183 RepID=UPI0001A62575|nr:hypothetical protein Smp_112610 [Schistosoma mansoni]|eukprot:XP_018644556.1 hypothetical protein Smp_112610 [Schistosoma mansoni]